VVIWNASSVACQLGGRVEFAAYFADGSRDVAARNNQPIVLAPVTLVPGMTAPPEFTDIDHYLFMALAGAERDDPTQVDGTCRPADELSPSKLVLTVGTVSVKTPNSDLGTPSRAPSIFGCHGKVLLEAAHLPTP